MTQKLIAQGAEAKIFLDEKNKLITKDRISKTYRIKELDLKIIKQRTKAETKLLSKVSEIVNAPKPIESKELNKIIMPFIDGKKLSEHLDNFSLVEQKNICKQIGESVAKIHESSVIHGDLTTSNIILVENGKSIAQKFKKRLEELEKLKLPKKDYVIEGGGPLTIRNIRDTEDIDIIVTKNLWEKLSKKYSIEKKDVGNKIIENIKIGKIEIQNDLITENRNLVHNSEILEGFPFLKLEMLIKRKKIFGREKDLKDIQLIKEHLKRCDNSKKIFFIDFGLGYISHKVEDKAVDLHLLKQALEAKHFKHWEILFKEFCKGYERNSEHKKILERLNAVERRGRYRH